MSDATKNILSKDAGKLNEWFDFFGEEDFAKNLKEKYKIVDEEEIQNLKKWREELSKTDNPLKTYKENVLKADKTTSSFGKKAGDVFKSLGANLLSIGIDMGIGMLVSAISMGVDALIHAEEKAAEKATEEYEKAKENVDKFYEREQVVSSSTKELLNLLSSEDWGAESAKAASEIYKNMADELESIGGVENSRIEQLREEGNAIRDNITLSKEQRELEIDKIRQSTINSLASESKINEEARTAGKAQHAWWKDIEKEFEQEVNYKTYPLKGNVLTVNDLPASKEGYEAAVKIMAEMKDYIAADSIGREYLVLSGNNQFNDMEAFMEKAEKIKSIPGAKDTPLYDAIMEIYDKFNTNEYKSFKKYYKERDIYETEKDARKYFNDNGIKKFDNQKDYEDFKLYLKSKRHLDSSIETLEPKLEDGGLFTEEYWKDVEKAARNADKMTDSLTNLKTASESLATIGSLYEDFNKDGYASVETLEKLSEQLNLSSEEWDKF